MRIINRRSRVGEVYLAHPAFLVSFPDSAAISGANLIDESNFYQSVNKPNSNY
jgi:hypothetical protein